MNLFLIYGINLLILSTQSRNLGGFPGDSLDGSVLNDQSSGNDLVNQDGDMPLAPPLSPWSTWMNLKAPPVAFLKPKKKGFPLYGISAPVTSAASLQPQPAAPQSIEAPWTSWMKLKGPPVATIVSNPAIESPWAAWTNLKIGGVKSIISPNPGSGVAESTLAQPATTTTHEARPMLKSSGESMRLSPVDNASGTVTPDAEETLLLKWAKKIFAFQNNKLGTIKGNNSLIESAWEEWQKLHNDTTMAIPNSDPMVSDFLTPLQKEKLVLVLQSLKVPPTKISDVMTPSSMEIAAKLTELKVPPAVIRSIIVSSPEIITNELLKIGILPPRVVQIMSAESSQIPVELEKLGIPQEKIKEIVTPPISDIREKLEELHLAPQDIELVLSPTTSEIMKKLEKLRVLNAITANEEVEHKLDDPIFQVPGTMIPPPQIIATELSKLGIPPPKIEEILTAKPQIIAAELSKLGIPPPKIGEILTAPPQIIATELSKLGIPPPKIGEILTAPSQIIAAELSKLGIPPPKIGEILTAPPQIIATELSKLGIPPPKIGEILTAPPQIIAAELSKLGIPPPKIGEILTAPPQIIAAELSKLGIPPPKIGEILTAPPQIIAAELSKLGLLPLMTPELASTKAVTDFDVPESGDANLTSAGTVFSPTVIDSMIISPQLLTTELQKLGLPSREIETIITPRMDILSSTLQELEIPADEVARIQLAPITKIESDLARLDITSSKLLQVAAAPNYPVVISALEKLGVPLADIAKVVSLPATDVPLVLKSYGLSEDAISKITTPPVEEIISELVRLGVPPTILPTLITATPDVLIPRLTKIGVPTSTISEIFAIEPAEVVTKLQALNVSSETIMTILSTIMIPKTEPEAIPAVSEIMSELIQMGVPPSQTVEILSTPPYLVGLALEKLGLPAENITELFTPSPEIIMAKLQTIGIPIPQILAVGTVPPKDVPLELYKIGIPFPEISKIMTPTPAELFNILESLQLPPLKIAEILTAPLDIVVPKLLEIGIPPSKIVEMVAETAPELAHQEILEVPTEPKFLALLPPGDISYIKQELLKLGLTTDEVVAIIESPSPEAPLSVTPSTVELTIPQLQELIQFILEECKKKSKTVRRTSNKKTKHGKKSGKSRAQNKRALYPTFISPPPPESTTKNPFNFIPSEMWDILPSVAPNTSIVDPGYWAAKKSMFISKLFEALAHVTMNYTNSATTTENPKNELMKRIDTVLLSDAARSVKGDEDESEEMSTRDEDLVDSGEPENLPKEPDNPLHKLFKFGVQKTILSDTSSTPATAMIITPPTLPTPTSTSSTLEQQKIILNKLKKLYQNTRKSYKNSQSKSKKKLRGPKTTVSPIDFEELAKALLVQPSK